MGQITWRAHIPKVSTKKCAQEERTGHSSHFGISYIPRSPEGLGWRVGWWVTMLTWRGAPHLPEQLVRRGDADTCLQPLAGARQVGLTLALGCGCEGMGTGRARWVLMGRTEASLVWVLGRGLWCSVAAVRRGRVWSGGMRPVKGWAAPRSRVG